MIIEGRNAVTEALRGETTLEKVLINKDLQGSYGEVIALCKKKGIKLLFVDKFALDRQSETQHHQGVLAVGTEFSYCDYDELLAEAEAPVLLLLLDSVTDPHNLGAIIRVADCCGATGIIIPKHRSCGVTDTVARISAGATAHVKIAKVTNLNDSIRDLKDRGITVFATDTDGESIYKTDLNKALAIVIGSEGEGVHALTKKLCDGVISLPQMGKINSLNASVATGVTVYEVLRQRKFK